METSSADTGSSSTNDVGPERQGAGDSHALTLAAGKFVRITVAVFGRKAGQFEKLGCALHRGRAGLADEPKRLGDNRPHGHARMKRGERILKHHLQVTPGLPHPRGRQGCDVDAFEPDFAGSRFDEPEDATPEGRFAAAGLSLRVPASRRGTDRTTRRRPPARAR